MKKNEILLGTYPVQKDMRIRLPKQIINNSLIQIGTNLNIYLNTNKNELTLRINKDLEGVNGKK